MNGENIKITIAFKNGFEKMIKIKTSNEELQVIIDDVMKPSNGFQPGILRLGGLLVNTAEVLCIHFEELIDESTENLVDQNDN